MKFETFLKSVHVFVITESMLFIHKSTERGIYGGREITVHTSRWQLYRGEYNWLSEAYRLVSSYIIIVGCPSDWCSGKALTSHGWDPGLIPGVACEVVKCLLSWTGWFPPSTPVSSHTKTTWTQSSVPRSMISISCMYLFCNPCKNKYKKFEGLRVWHDKTTQNLNLLRVFPQIICF